MITIKSKPLKNLTSSFALVFLFLNPSIAQKHDYIWLSGYDSHVGFDTSWGFYFGKSVLDFHYTPLQVSYDSLEMNFDATNASFCDSGGNMLFYTNGIF